MKPQFARRQSEKAYALLVVMVIMIGMLLVLGTLLDWTTSSFRVTDRANEYYTTADAAEAATEKVLVRLSRDYLSSGDATVLANISAGNYSSVYPTTTDSSNSYWGSYYFINANNSHTNSTWVAQSNSTQYVVLSGQYTGLYGYRDTIYVTSRAMLQSSRYGIIAAVGQWVGLESIPLFQFTIFYNLDLEMEPGSSMTILGRVHSNSNIWTFPNSGVTLTYSNDVTAAGLINDTFMPGDPDHSGSGGTVVFDGEHDGGTSTLNLPIGTNNTASNVYAVLQIPPAGESPTSAMGSNRYYNMADTILIISNSSVTAMQNSTNGSGTTIPTNIWQNFLNTNVNFYNGRESIDVQADMINVSNLVSWANASSNIITGASNSLAPNTIYIADERSLYYSSNYVTSSHGVNITNNVHVPVEPGILLFNGSEIPHSGLTVASPDPMYVWGNYNTTTNRSSFSVSENNNTSNTYPASVLGDAITILSNNWNTNNNNGVSTTAASTTINAALLGGIVPTTSASYSGGVENFPRLLENWGSATLYYNGSMVAMFNSQVATGLWTGTGGYYDPATRSWAFDNNFTNQAKLPPHTPQILFMERLQWAFRTPTIGVVGSE